MQSVRPSTRSVHAPGHAARARQGRQRAAAALFVLLSLALPALSTACRSAAPAAAPTLREIPTQPTRVDVEPGASHRYALPLEGPRFVQIAVAQLGVDLRVSLLAPGGETLAVADGPGGAQGRELLIAVTAAGGLHQVVVDAPAQAGGHYQLDLLRLRAVEPGDEERVVALRAYADGRLLYARDAEEPRRRRALALFEEAERAAVAAGDGSLQAWALVQQAFVHSSLEAWPAALDTSRRSAALFRQPGNESGLGLLSALINLALAQSHDPRLHDEALATFAEAIAHARDQPEPDLYSEALLLNNRGELGLRTGDVRAAKNDFLRALELWQQVAETRERAKWETTTRINLGVAQRQLGEMVEALRSYEAAQRLAEEIGDRFDQVHLLSNLGRYYMIAGDLQKALDSLHRGLELARTLGDLNAERVISLNLGVLYRLLGAGDEALVHHGAALELSRRIGEPLLIGEALLQLARFTAEHGDEAASRRHLDAALEVAARAGSPSLEAEARRESARRLAAGGELGRALEEVLRAKRLSAGAPAPQVAAVLRTEAEVLRSLDRPGEAIDVLHEALRLGVEIYAPLEVGSIRNALFSLERSRGRLGAAREHLEAALELHDAVRATVANPELRASFLARRRDQYLALVEILMALHEQEPDGEHAAAALAASERSRARSLIELLSESRVDLDRRVDAELRRKEAEIDLRIALLQAEIDLTARAGSTGSVAAATLDRQRTSLEEARRQRERLADEIRSSAADYASLRYPSPLGLREIQRLLPADVALLEYVLGTEGSFVFVVTRDRFIPRPLTDCSRLGTWVDQVRATATSLDPRAAVTRSAASRRLHRCLLAPIQEEIARVERLWIVPDGPLFYLPFELLRGPLPAAPSAGRSEGYVVEGWQVSYVPSATVIPSLAAHRAAGDEGDYLYDFVGFAYPGHGEATPGAPRAAERAAVDALPALAHVEQEVRDIADLFPGQSRLYLGADAHQANLFDNPVVAGARRLHIAAHGLIREDDPVNSAILLFPDPSGDDLLNIGDVFRLDIRAETVVLSACDSGLGQEVRGEGLVGLSRAFFYAGASSVVVSLWPVSDAATRSLMRQFYAALAAGSTPAEALRRAKLSLLERSASTSPGLWAPFVLVGRDAASRNVVNGAVAQRDQ